jgi:hypothetical protein
MKKKRYTLSRVKAPYDFFRLQPISFLEEMDENDHRVVLKCSTWVGETDFTASVLTHLCSKEHKTNVHACLWREYQLLEELDSIAPREWWEQNGFKKRYEYLPQLLVGFFSLKFQPKPMLNVYHAKKMFGNNYGVSVVAPNVPSPTYELAIWYKNHITYTVTVMVNKLPVLVNDVMQITPDEITQVMRQVASFTKPPPPIE